jgi:hypothetical protein
MIQGSSRVTSGTQTAVPPPGVAIVGAGARCLTYKELTQASIRQTSQYPEEQAQAPLSAGRPSGVAPLDYPCGESRE